ncbi:MAG TPA: carbohydrate kinase family protein, partial [Dehalococcoidales bacterium]|nr:carbohydrate kinase family protein [Dehalococcoidales bacterium]
GNEVTLAKKLAEIYNIKYIACTRGERGSFLLSGEKCFDHPGYKAEIVDTVGAGDAFTAALTIGLLKGKDLDVINEAANRVAAFVCSRRGATPAMPEELKLILD